MPVLAKRKSNSTSILGFFLDDWKFILQTSIVLILGGVVLSVDEIISEALPGITAKSVVQANAAMVLSLIAPAVMFIFAGNCLFPQAGRLLKRLTAATFLIAFVACGLADGASSSSDYFLWSFHDSFTTTNLYSATASSVLLFSFFIVCYRFVGYANGHLFALFRLVLIAAAVVTFAISDRLSLTKKMIGSEGTLQKVQKVRVILVLKDFSFQEANDFLTSEADERFLESVQIFRPVVMPTSNDIGRLASFLSGQEAYAHGLRLDKVDGRNWELFQRSWENKLIELNTQGSFHFTNITSPSRFAAFFAAASADLLGTATLCPDKRDQPGLYQHLSRLQQKIIPAVPQWFSLWGLDHIGCVPSSTPIDDLIHREMIEGVAAPRYAHSNLVSMWVLDFSKYGGPLPETKEAAKELSTVKSKHLSMFLKTLTKNLEVLMLKDSSEIHVVGLAGPQESFGSYFYSLVGAARDSDWPLEDENVLTSLTKLSELLSPGSDPKMSLRGSESAQKRHAELLYFEEENSPLTQGLGAGDEAVSFQNGLQDRAPSAFTPVELSESYFSAALSSSRKVLCTFNALEGEADRAQTRLDLVEVQLNTLFAQPSWQIKENTDYRLEPMRDLQSCVEKSLKRIQVAIDRDVLLFEPYLRSGDILPLALSTFDEENKE